jgi:hypothetical protein
MAEVGSRVRGFLRNRWLVFVAAMWMQSCAGVGYLFGSLSPVIKASLGYNQRQVAGLGVAKDLGDSVGFLAGTLCAVLPLWAALLVGAAQNLVGYGWVWLAVTRRVPVPPLWAVRSPRLFIFSSLSIIIRPGLDAPKLEFFRSLYHINF